MDLYTALVLITIMVLGLSVIDIRSSRVIDAAMRRNSTITCCLIGLALLFEWVGVKTNGADLSWTAVHKLAKLAEFCIAPLLGVLATASYARIRRPKLIAVLAAIHMAFEAVALHFGWVISIDSSNLYHRGKLYAIYITISFLSILFCIISTLRTDFRYYAKPSLILSATLAFLVIGIGLQIINSEIRTDYLCVAIANYFFFNHRRKLVLQLDGLTSLLNRGCLEKDLDNIRMPTGVLLMDVNDFKQLNDTYGHATGDSYLRAVADVIRNVFGRYGMCYRYGGDEFCVLLTKDTEHAQQRIRTLQEQLSEKQEADSLFPSVSIGYARYDQSCSHIQKVLQEADSKCTW